MKNTTMFTNKRPNVEESEEDILSQEKSFLESLSKQQSGQGRNSSFEPAAKVVKKSKEKETDAKSSSGVLQNQKNVNEQMDEAASDDEEFISPMHQMPLEHPVEPVLSSCIKERAFDPARLLSFTGQSSLPKILPIDKSVASKGFSKERKGRGKSLFARSYDASFGASVSASGSTIMGGLDEMREMKSSGKRAPPIIGDKIHPLLAGMTQKDILEEQKKLMEKLDPKLVEFIRSRKGNKSYLDLLDDSVYSVNMDIAENVTDNENVKNETDESINVNTATKNDLQNADLPIDPEAVKGFPGMQKVELDKLAWTGVIKEDRVKFDKPDEECNARFDFKGMLIPSKAMNDPTTYEKGLHHHGEEMERPGYTLEELLTLARSTNNQQRSTALHTIGNIYENAHTGMYDFVFEKSLFQLADYMDFIYAIRKGLDEDDISSVNTALQCLAEIVYPWEEEICLDVVYLCDDAKPHPWISTKEENMRTTEEPELSEGEMKDAEVLNVDLLEFLIQRSNLLNRLKYFFERGDAILNENGVHGALKLLIRIARHSPNELIKHKALMKLLIERHCSANWNLIGSLPQDLKGVPLPMALKIIRILIDSSSENASQIYSEFNIFPAVMSYLAYDDWRSKEHIRMVESLVMESFRIWIAFITHGLAIDEYLSFFPVLMRFMTVYKASDSLNSFDLYHSGHVFSLLIAVLRMKDDSKGIQKKDRHSHWGLVKDGVSFVEPFVTRLFAVASSLHLIGTFDHNALFFSLTKGLRLLNEASKYQSNQLSTNLLNGACSFISSTTYSKITSELIEHSVILMDKEEGRRYPPNFASVKAIRFGGTWNPVVHHGSSLSFLASLFEFIRLTKSVVLDKLINSHITAYVSKILKSTTRSEEADFFVRFEISFICELVELYPVLAPERFYLAYKALSEVPQCCNKLFNRMFTLALNSSCDENDRENSFKIYGGYLFNPEEENNPFDKKETKDTDDSGSSSAKKVRFDENAKLDDGPRKTKLEFHNWTEKSIGSHWILEPLQRIHTIVRSVPNFLESNLQEIEVQCRICLQLIEKILKKYSDFIVQTTKDFVAVYCNICQIFLLGDPRIYFDETISQLLLSILQVLSTCAVAVKNKNSSIFSKQRRAEGLPNMFFDFYPDLLKEYAGNSYFNEVFASYLTVPLRNPEDSQIKSNFWTMDCLHSIRITREKSKVPIEFLTTGIEKDPKMHEIYLKLFYSDKVSKERNEFLFEVLKRNLQNAAESNQMDDKLREHFLQLKI